MLEVVAGIIWKDQKVLVAQRGEHKHLAGKWEFPGGKIEPGESPEQALERELKEEFSIDTHTTSFFELNIHHYPTFTIKLIAYHSEYISGDISLTDHDQAKWIDICEIKQYDFAEADIPIATELASRFYNKGR